MGLMMRYSHPRLNDVSLEAALHALADPCRFAIVRRLAGQAGELSCQPSPQAGAVPKTTLSNPSTILPGPGLTRTRPPRRPHPTSLPRPDSHPRLPPPPPPPPHPP